MVGAGFIFKTGFTSWGEKTLSVDGILKTGGYIKILGHNLSMLHATTSSDYYYL